MAARQVLMLFPSLEDKGGVTVFCRSLSKNLEGAFKIEHFQIGNRPGNRSLIKRVFYFCRDLFNLKKTLHRNRYDVVHLNPSLRVLSLLRDSLFLSMINKGENNLPKTLVMFHGWSRELAERIHKNFFYRKIFLKIYEKASLILVLSRDFKKQLEKIGLPKDRIMITTTMYEKEKTDQKIQEKGKEGKTNILFMARLEKAKGVHIAAEVSKLLVEDGRMNFKFFFAGDGSESLWLRRYAKKYMLNRHIEILGYLRGKRKQEVLGESDIFLLPSSSEGCPVAVLEAMGGGLAVISTPVGAIPDVVENNINGLIVESLDPKDFYAAVKILLDDKQFLREMQLANIRKAETLYEAKVVTKKFQLLYQSLMASK